MSKKFDIKFRRTWTGKFVLQVKDGEVYRDAIAADLPSLEIWGMGLMEETMAGENEWRTGRFLLKTGIIFDKVYFLVEEWDSILTKYAKDWYHPNVADLKPEYLA